MEINLKIEKKHFIMISILLFVAVISFAANMITAAAPLGTAWHPLSSISADGGLSSIDNGSGYIRADIIEGGGFGSLGQLTWNGIGGPSTHTEDDCHAIGGGVYDTIVSGTICKIVGTDIEVPSGWQQAESWQSYNPSTWGGDICGHHKSYGPVAFGNDVSKKYTTGMYIGMPNTDCASDIGNWHTAGNAPYNHRIWTVIESPGDSFNRNMLGIY